jgi:peptidoglycan hydrolase FlgJ
LPDNDEIYGKGATGEIWKGMMAEQLGNALAKEGGIGIAESLAKGGSTKLADEKQIFEKNRGDRMHQATQIIDENQMKALDKFLPGDHAVKKT